MLALSILSPVFSFEMHRYRILIYTYIDPNSLPCLKVNRQPSNTRLFCKKVVCLRVSYTCIRPRSPKIIKRIGNFTKDYCLVGIYNQQFEGTIILMVLDFQGKYMYTTYT